MMSDILIRDVPDDVLAAIDTKAHMAGLSRTEYLRRTLARERNEAVFDVTTHDLADFAETFADLGNDTVMDAAWQ